MRFTSGPKRPLLAIFTLFDRVPSRLLREVQSIYSGLGFETIELGVLAANTQARAFYETMGGRLIAEREFDEEGTMLPEVVYGWDLTG